jgi:phosphatidate cytidylyltransferase
MTEMTKRSITSTVLGIFVWIALVYLPSIVFSIFLAGALLHIMIFEWPKFFNIKQLTFWIITPFYPLLPFALLFALNADPNLAYHELLFYMFVLVSSHDTGSFMVGTAYGNHKIAPMISPAKSWEGFFGGYLTALISMAILIVSHGKEHGSWIALFAVTFVICAISFAGDLFESWLKRRAGIKDSGHILPGHGGFLDRFDGILFAIFFFYLFKEQLSILFGT